MGEIFGKWIFADKKVATSSVVVYSGKNLCQFQRAEMEKLETSQSSIKYLHTVIFADKPKEMRASQYPLLRCSYYGKSLWQYQSPHYA